jgi:two-component SAPR family response regulator
MNYLILEDEQWAAERLASLISEIRPDWNSLGVKDSVKSAKTFLKQQAVDLIFVDINLGDGLSFSIFQDITAQCPLIFTTAYDQYAIKAFKLNSIDYLLKPISKEELSAAINKFESLNSSAVSDWQKLIKD